MIVYKDIDELQVRIVKGLYEKNGSNSVADERVRDMARALRKMARECMDSGFMLNDVVQLALDEELQDA